MLGDTIDVIGDERRYNQLLNEGMLPSGAIKRIENEKRLGIVVDSGTDWGEISLGKIAVVGLGLIVGYYILKGKSGAVSETTSGLGKINNSIRTIDDIIGIDVAALAICRENGLM